MAPCLPEIAYGKEAAQRIRMAPCLANLLAETPELCWLPPEPPTFLHWQTASEPLPSRLQHCRPHRGSYSQAEAEADGVAGVAAAAI